MGLFDWSSDDDVFINIMYVFGLVTSFFTLNDMFFNKFNLFLLLKK